MLGPRGPGVQPAHLCCVSPFCCLVCSAVRAAFGVTGAEFSPWLPVLPGHLTAHGLCHCFGKTKEGKWENGVW